MIDWSHLQGRVYGAMGACQHFQKQRAEGPVMRELGREVAAAGREALPHVLDDPDAADQWGLGWVSTALKERS